MDHNRDAPGKEASPIFPVTLRGVWGEEDEMKCKNCGYDKCYHTFGQFCGTGVRTEYEADLSTGYTAADLRAAKLETVERCIRFFDERGFLHHYEEAMFSAAIEKLKEEINAS